MNNQQTAAALVNGRDVNYDPRRDLIGRFAGDEWGEETAADLQSEYTVDVIKPVLGWAPYTHLARVLCPYDENRPPTYALVTMEA